MKKELIMLAIVVTVAGMLHAIAVDYWLCDYAISADAKGKEIATLKSRNDQLQKQIQSIQSSTGSKRDGFTFFHLDQQRFVKTIADCILDSNCTIQYLHTGKTGGNFIEYKMATILNRRHVHSCCGDTMMDRFWKAPQKYCNAPFSSYQVNFERFFRILHTCQEESSKRRVILSTYREPLARAVSYVHQTCNKNLAMRTAKELEICKRCNYNDDPEFYNSMTILGPLSRNLLTNYTFWSWMDTADTDLLALDNSDINQFFSGLKRSLPVNFRKRFENETSIESNPESKKHCDFKMPSSMIKAYAREVSIYRNLSLGIIRS